MSYIKFVNFNKKIIFPVALSISAIIIALSAITGTFSANTTDAIAESVEQSFQTDSLYARYACLMDGSNGRVLVDKNASAKVPMASTTKIMTCIIALEYSDMDYLCTTSLYAASMPDVQLNAAYKQTFNIRDLLYSLMLRSHNDTAVIIAENVAYRYIYNARHHIADDFLGIADDAAYDFINLKALDSSFIGTISVEQSKLLTGVFAMLMNDKAARLGCTDTLFITPNGLDASNENGTHSTTAKDLCTIMAYCITNSAFLEITQTHSYSFDRYTLTNANAFLNSYPSIISGKTGFTADAGYCYVCAYNDGERTFIVSLLACGWPNNKTYKWKDSKKLLDYARSCYFPADIVSPGDIRSIRIKEGILADGITIHNPLSYSALLQDEDKVNVVYNVPDELTAPLHNGQTLGSIDIYINDSLQHSIPLYCNDNIDRKDLYYHINYIKNLALFIDKD